MTVKEVFAISEAQGETIRLSEEYFEREVIEPNTPNGMKKDDKKMLISIVLGAAAGFAFYYFVGCSSGGCPLTSNPWTSTGYGALLGWLAASAW